jgi:23S rRNA (guanosine2251-2'-O)-methyltransferase
MGPQATAPRRQATTGLGGEQVEGRQAVRELLLANRRDTREIWVAADLDRAPVLDEIRELAAEARVLVKEVGRGKLDAAARTDAPQGVIAFAKPLPESTLSDLLAPRPSRPVPFLLLSDGITDPGNLGALLRSAECAGVTGVVLPQHRAVHVTPTVAKAAAGAIEHLPFALVGGMAAAIKELREAGVWVVGLDERADTPLWSLPVAGDAPVALVLGAEGPGLSRLVRERCDELVSIPMRGRVASLNVATAGALACFEVARLRAADLA